ncbi:KpsF/GutQ family sugar-phosphate isomerase [Ponticaulis profundi]|uniref:SIS domain-containing protein n=1 Tax=Ponticaulis profundi TaxID=2665222 RepID=A0ABW1SDR0_9PROT
MSEAADRILSALKRTIAVEIDGMTALEESLGDEAIRVVECLSRTKGRLACAGVGKSGHVARKIAATLASTGTQAYFVHPAEASHGDLGMISTDDAVLALSKSGETKELSDLIAYCRRFSVPLIGMTMEADSALGRASDYLLLVPNAAEACGETRAPTTSTTLMMALGDALAVALIEKRGFTAEDFKRYHPGGSLGAALTSAKELMHSGDEMPLVETGTSVPDAVAELSRKGFGCMGIVSSQGALIGIITDGDLRRHLSADLPSKSVDEIMTKSPVTIAADVLAADVLRQMTSGSKKLTQIFVTDADNKPVGFIHMHDLLKIGVS